VEEGLGRFAKLLNINSTPISSALALFKRAVEPYDGIESTSNKHLRRLFMSCGLHKQECFFHLDITSDGVQLCGWLVTTHGFFKKLRLGIVAWEVDKDPT